MQQWVRLLTFLPLLTPAALQAQPCPIVPRWPVDSAALRLRDSLLAHYDGAIFYHSVHYYVHRYNTTELFYGTGKRMTQVQFLTGTDGQVQRVDRRIRRPEAVTYFYRARVDTVHTQPQTEVVVTHDASHYVYVRHQGREFCYGVSQALLSDSTHPRARLVLLFEKARRAPQKIR